MDNGLDNTRLLTENEQAVLDTLAEAWNQFLKLQPIRKDIWDRTEFMHTIHAAQYIVLSRPAMREIWESDDGEEAGHNAA